MGLDAQIIANQADPIPAGGGILVGYTQGQGFEGTDPSSHAEWKLKVKKKRVRVTLTTLAPGLTVYRARAKTKGKATLVDGHGKKLGTYAFTGKKQPFSVAAPGVQSLTTTTTTGSRGGPYTHSMITLDAKPPAGAYALIIYDGATALTWAFVEGVEQTAFNVYGSPGRCGAQPAGMTAPYAAQNIEAAWVDRFGRLSPRSAAIAVTTASTDASSGTTVGP
jgi:hypothetical protein